MRIIGDLHIHSKFARATSKEISIFTLEKYAKLKGLNLLGTGDFTHPTWLRILKEELTEDGTGILKTKNGFNFMLQTEVSSIYTQDNKVRKIHNIVYVKSFEIAEQVNELLSKKGNLLADGRPIFRNYPCHKLVEDLKNIDKNIEIIPAHVWTPFYSCMGSKSGFNSVEECFREQTKHIFALETGLSSDPEMNWRLSALDKFSLVSNSDAHSFWPWRLGRECNIFDTNMTYDDIMNAIKTKKGFVMTVEVDPNYGKYHFDGHRNCNVCLEPREAIKNNNFCPVCKRKLTIGVLHRVEELADRPQGFKPKDAVPFKKIIPLSEIISRVLKTGLATQKVWKEYHNLVNNFGSEFNVLLETPFEKLVKITNEHIANAIINIRNEKIKIQPGYDGEYGYPIFDEKEIKEMRIKKEQKGLGDFF